MTKHTNLRVVKTYDEPFECEDCGSCYPEGLYVEYNGEVIWEKFSDGHLSGHQTEDSIVNTILNKWYVINEMIIHNNYTEQKRNEWNKNHPGNGVASTTESWSEYKKSSIDYLSETLESLKTNCENLPYNETLQVKMIALWLEADTEEVFDIEVDSEKYTERN